jgi:hypothetical protein
MGYQFLLDLVVLWGLYRLERHLDLLDLLDLL